MSKYDTEHPKKEVPAEVVDDVDNDMWYDSSLISKNTIISYSKIYIN